MPAHATIIAREGEGAGAASSVDAARPAIAAISRADALLGAAWARLRARAAVIELESR